MSELYPLVIRAARWPDDEAAAVGLLRHYADDLRTRLPAAACDHIEQQEKEFARLEMLWTLPQGVFLLAFWDVRPCGCVGLKVRDDRDGAVEMKRLWTEPVARGMGLGRRLVQAAVAWSRSAGYRTILLDTVPAAMPEAAALYRSLGFHETTRHNDNPVEHLAFFQLDLD